MTYNEALDVVGMVVRSWPGGREWTSEEMDAYATGIMWMAPEPAVAAVAAALQRVQYRPSVAELREFYDIERAKTRAATEKPERQWPQKRETVPLWVRRWVAARYLYRSFGKDQDMRRFPQQQMQHSPDFEMMPADAWLDEAEHVTEDRVWRTIGG